MRAVTEQLTDAMASDVFWDRMIRITPVGDAPVYDLTVPGVHNFLANGIFVHNSIEQDADIVMFIFREDAYDRESEKKGIAEIIVAKHRNGPTDTVNLRFFERTARFADLELPGSNAVDRLTRIGRLWMIMEPDRMHNPALPSRLGSSTSSYRNSVTSRRSRCCSRSIGCWRSRIGVRDSWPKQRSTPTNDSLGACAWARHHGHRSRTSGGALISRSPAGYCFASG